MSNSSVAALSTASGLSVPILYGTAWKKERTTELVLMAVLAGFRGIDTACQPKHYAEEQVGAALATLQAKHGIPRADIFVQTKFTSLDGQDPARVPYDRNAPLEEQVRQSFAKSLQNLRTDYLDSLVLHGPMRSTDQNVAVWRVFEHFHGEGRVRRLGLSNFYSLGQLTALYEEARVKPTILQNRFYAQTGYDREIRQFCRQKGIVYQSFWTLTANPHALRNPAVRQLAQRRGITPEQLFFRYTMDVGITPLSGTTSREHAQQDVAVAAMKPMDQEEIGTVEEALFGGGGGRKSEF